MANKKQRRLQSVKTKIPAKKKPAAKQKQPKLLEQKMLAWSDSPRVATGFGIVAQYILTAFASQGVLIDVLGVNDPGGWYPPQLFPYRIYPAMPGAARATDVYGRNLLQTITTGKSPYVQGPWNAVWVLADHFILEQRGNPPFDKGSAWFLREIVERYKKELEVDTKLIVYSPVDSPLKENWVVDGLLPFDIIVSYTQYGRREITKACPAKYLPELEKKLVVIPHGVDTDLFKPAPKKEIAKFKKQYFQKSGWLKEEDFLIINVNRNQQRKDLMRTLEVFRRFNQIIPDSKIYLHCKPQDVAGNILEMARVIGLDIETIRVCGEFNPFDPAPGPFMNLLYNSADVVISTSTGEGWGMSTTEAMSAARPVVIHNVTSTAEILNTPRQNLSDLSASNNKTVLPPAKNQRGIGISTSDFCCFGPQDLERFRPLANVNDFVDALLWVYENEDEAEAMGNRARKWLIDEQMDWTLIGKRWVDLLEDCLLE